MFVCVCICAYVYVCVSVCVLLTLLLGSECARKLRDFTAYLTQLTHSRIPNGIVLWYDSVTEDGDLKWQNELNSKNQVSARVSG